MVLSFKQWRNKSGTGDRVCRCGTWSQHWINYSGQSWPQTCSVDTCLRWPWVGGHVFRSPSTEEFIVPLCAVHNGATEPFALKPDVVRVSANRKDTCER